MKKCKREACHEYYGPKREKSIGEEENYGMIKWHE
jgi:hypothetical protein